MAVRRGQGEGSIYQRSDGSWIAQIDMGIVDGKRSRPIRRAKTKREALKKLEEMKRARDAGAVPSTAPLSRWLDYWLDEIVSQQLAAGAIKPSTEKRYRQDVKTWLRPQLGHVRLDRLGPTHVRGLHKVMREAGRTDATIRNAHACLRRALTTAVDDGLLPRVPFGGVSAPSPKTTYAALTRAQAGQLFAAVAGDPRTLARVHVAILGGLRQGEALALRWGDVTDSHIMVASSLARVDGELVHQSPKTVASRRAVPIAPALAASLAAWRGASGASEDDYVFHGHRGPGTPEGAERDSRAWGVALARAGLPHVPLHGARGTCATILQDLGVPPRVVADILGQSQVRTTLDHYSHSDELTRALAIERLGEALSGEGDG